MLMLLLSASNYIISPRPKCFDYLKDFVHNFTSYTTQSVYAEIIKVLKISLIQSVTDELNVHFVQISLGQVILDVRS